MEKVTVAYRGFEITVTAGVDHDDLWDFEYQIAKTGDGATQAMVNSEAQTRTMGQYATEVGACDAGIEVAKIEVDNLIALTQK